MVEDGRCSRLRIGSTHRPEAPLLSGSRDCVEAVSARNAAEDQQSRLEF